MNCSIVLPPGLNPIIYEYRSSPPPWNVYPNYQGWNWSAIQQPLRFFQAQPYAVTAYRLWVYGTSGPGVVPVTVQYNVPGGPTTTIPISVDARTPDQIAAAPKISIGAPGGEDGYMNFGLFGNGLRIAAAGRISDPGHPINPNGLELQVDENGVRRSVNVPVGPDGSFHIDGLVALGPNGPSGRPLFFYNRTAGDQINVGYCGNGTEVERKKELKTFQYDALRNKIGEAVKAEPGRFRHIRTNGVTLGVRG